MLRTILPQVGTARAAAEYLLDRAKQDDEATEADFDGTPMRAELSDTPDMVAMRWHYERLLIQIADKTVSVHDYADARYVKQ